MDKYEQGLQHIEEARRKLEQEGWSEEQIKNALDPALSFLKITLDKSH